LAFEQMWPTPGGGPREDMSQLSGEAWVYQLEKRHV